MNDTLVNGTNSFIPITTIQPAVGTALNSIQLILGLPINSYVLRLILSGAGGTIASEFFYLNLIVSVFLSSLASTFSIAWLFTYNSILKRVIIFAFDLFLLFSIPLFQCCICVERYIAVVHPVVFLRYKALRYRVVCCCAVWMTGLLVSLLDVILYTVYSMYFLLGFWMMCISVVCFCCLAVLRALKQPGPGEGQRDSGEGNDLKRRAFRTILISLVVMSVTTMSYIPLSVFPLLNYYNQIAANIASIIIAMSVFVHPLLYLHKAGKLPCFKAWQHESPIGMKAPKISKAVFTETDAK